MKIALVTFSLKMGGIATFMENLARWFRDERGWEAEFVETLAAGECGHWLREEGWPVRTVGAKPLRSRYAHVKKVARALSSFDAVLINEAPCAQSALGLLPERTAVLSVIHLGIPSFVRNGTVNLSQVDRVVSVSEGVRRRVMEDASAAGEKLELIWNGVPVPERWPKERHPFDRDRPLKVIFFGRIDHSQKGVLHLPTILDRTAKGPGSVEMTVVGSGPDEGELKRLMASRLPDCPVRFYGTLQRERMREVLAGQDVLLLPSSYEGHPLSVMEAMAAGVVPVTTRLEGVTDGVVTDGVNGFLFSPLEESGGDGVEMPAEALLRLMEDRGRLREMSERAWRKVKANFDVRGMAGCYARLLESLAEEKRERKAARTGTVPPDLLGDYPDLPVSLVRPVRKLMRTLGRYERDRPFFGEGGAG